MSLSLNKEILDRCIAFSDTFVETGTFMGGGVRAAFNHGFKKIYSIEMSPELFALARKNTSDIPCCEIILGDASIALSVVLASLTKPCCVFLDSHNMKGNKHSEKVKGDGVKWKLAPVRLEIEALRNASLKSHLIMVDDIDFCGKAELDFVTVDELKRLILAVNPDYKFDIMHAARANSCLVATP